jgi:Spy/CpxP family protein refolding chaperone
MLVAHHDDAMSQRAFPRRRLALFVLTSTVLAGTLLGPAPAEAGKGKGRGHAKLDRLCEQITCTEAQKQDIGEVFKQLRVDVKPDREAIRDLRRQLAGEWAKDRPDEAKLAKLADKIAAHERNIADRRMEAMLELHALLSPEQREQVAEHLMKRGGKR